MLKNTTVSLLCMGSEAARIEHGLTRMARYGCATFFQMTFHKQES